MPSRSSEAAVTSAVSGPTRTRARFPTGTIDDTGARRWFSAESAGCSRASDTSHGCTTTPTRPLPLGGRPDDAAAVEHDLRQAVRAGLRVTRQEIPAAQARDERIRGRVDELLWRPRLDEPTVDEDADPVCERRGVLEVVRHEQRRQALLAEDPLELDADRLPGVRVECGQRLVEEEHPGPARERAGERDPLALPAGELARPCRGEMPDPEPIEQLGDAVAAAVAHIARDGQVREERVVLEHVADRTLLGGAVQACRRVEPRLVAEPHDAALRPQEAGHRPEHARLSRTRRPDERERLARDLGGQLEAERAEGVEKIETERVHAGTTFTASRSAPLTRTRSALIPSATSKLTSNCS